MPGPGGRLRNTRSEGTGGTLAREDLSLSLGAGRSGLKAPSTRPQRRSKPPKRGTPTGSRIKLGSSRRVPRPLDLLRKARAPGDREDDDARQSSRHASRTAATAVAPRQAPGAPKGASARPGSPIAAPPP